MEICHARILVKVEIRLTDSLIFDLQLLTLVIMNITLNRSSNIGYRDMKNQ